MWGQSSKQQRTLDIFRSIDFLQTMSDIMSLKILSYARVTNQHQSANVVRVTIATVEKRS